MGNFWECLRECRRIHTCLTDRFFNIHDRGEELKESAPSEVRRASHDLANATMAAEGSMREVRRQADALSALVRRMRYRDEAK